MSETTCLTGAAHVLTCAGPDRGPVADWATLGLASDSDVVLESRATGWYVTWIGPRAAADRPAADRTIDLGGRVLMPGFVDAHTHAVFAGDRSAEFSRRLSGASYADIAADGGGILATMAATRAAPVEDLVAQSAPRLAEMRRWGVRLVEIKTGYGMQTDAEVRQLLAIGALAERFDGQIEVVATAMPAHAVPPEHSGDPDAYVAYVCDDIVPALTHARDQEAIPCPFFDVFIDEGYFSLENAERLWMNAIGQGLRMKAHVDEFADLGGVAWAVERGAVSVDHLLVTSAESVACLAASSTVAVCLPLTSLFLRTAHAPMRDLVDAGALLALATDCNPGSAMTTNLPLALQIAVLEAALSPQEAIRAVTRCGALAVAEPAGFCGRIAVGERFLGTAFDIAHPDALFYELGAPPRAWIGFDEALAAT